MAARGAQGKSEAIERWAALSEAEQAEALRGAMAELKRQLGRMEGNLQRMLRAEEEMKVKGGSDNGSD